MDTLLGSDVAPSSYEAPKGFAMMLDVDQPEDADRLFRHSPTKEGWGCRFSNLLGAALRLGHGPVRNSVGH